MPLVTLDATVLQAFPYSETSKILRIFTPTHGVQSVLARGARRARSRYGGVLEPFTDGRASFHFRETRDLHNLNEFELVRPRQGLGRDLVRFGAASLVAEITLRTATGEPAPGLFRQVARALDTLEQAPPTQVESVALAQVLGLITALGFAPSLDRCVGCDQDVPDAALLFLDYAAGGVFCERCGAGAGAGGAGAGRVLPPQVRRDLTALSGGQPVPLDRTAAHWQLVGRFLAYHVLEADSLRSLDFLAGAVEAQ
jgi:DNA repair protein RecO (recombination protein O)